MEDHHTSSHKKGLYLSANECKNRNFLNHRFPALSKKISAHFDQITTSAFALGVAEEWTGLLITFALHLLIHCIQALVLRKYVPAIITSIICLPICIYIISNVVKLFPLNDVILYSVLSFVFMVVNPILIHKAMEVFSKWSVK